MIINKKRSEKIFIDDQTLKIDSHKKKRFSQMITNKNKCIQITKKF